MAEAVEPRQMAVGGRGGSVRHLRGLVHHLAAAQAGGASEDDQIGQAVGAETVGPVHRDTGRLTHRHQAGDDGVGIVADLGQDLAVIVRRDAAHIVVNGRQDRDRGLGHIDAGEDFRALGNARQALVQHGGIEVVEVQVDVVLVRAHAAAFADLDGHRA